MATTADIKIGLCIEFNGDLFQIVDFQHVKPGKGPAFVRTKLKNLKTGRVIDNTFNSGVKISTARVVKVPHQFLYKDDSGYIFMNQETFDQLILQEGNISNFDLMKEGQNIDITFHEETETPLYTELPSFIELDVIYTEPGVKGDTATNTLKSATLETNATIMVPLFINIGDRLRIDTRTKEYVERAKK
jgi:elongation factor P